MVVGLTWNSPSEMVGNSSGQPPACQTPSPPRSSAARKRTSLGRGGEGRGEGAELLGAAFPPLPFLSPSPLPSPPKRFSGCAAHNSSALGERACRFGPYSGTPFVKAG